MAVRAPFSPTPSASPWWRASKATWRLFDLATRPDVVRGDVSRFTRGVQRAAVRLGCHEGAGRRTPGDGRSRARGHGAGDAPDHPTAAYRSHRDGGDSRDRLRPLAESARDQLARGGVGTRTAVRVCRIRPSGLLGPGGVRVVGADGDQAPEFLLR